MLFYKYIHIGGFILWGKFSFPEYYYCKNSLIWKMEYFEKYNLINLSKINILC